MVINKRFNGKCKGCGFKSSAFVASVQYSKAKADYMAIDDIGHEVGKWNNGVVRTEHACATHHRLTLHSVVGKLVPEHVCNAKCMESIGFLCECSCGGKNHGSGHSSHVGRSAA